MDIRSTSGNLQGENKVTYARLPTADLGALMSAPKPWSPKPITPPLAPERAAGPAKRAPRLRAICRVVLAGLNAASARDEILGI